ncbi:hypothetical protein ACHAWF_000116, partial [Thalassiosira exigua]
TPKAQLRRLRSLSAPHVRSFDYFLDVGLVRGVSDIAPFEVDLVDLKLPENKHVGYVEGKGADTLKFWLEDVKMGMPTKTQPSGISGGGGGGGGGAKSMKLFPRECRELGVMYSAPLSADACLQLVRRDGYGNEVPSGAALRVRKNFGAMPVMVGSRACHLAGKSPQELIKLREEATEFGGYFLVNGIERLVRLLQVPRANHASAVQRSNFKNRGPLYSDLG